MTLFHGKTTQNNKPELTISNYLGAYYFTTKRETALFFSKIKLDKNPQESKLLLTCLVNLKNPLVLNKNDFDQFYMPRYLDGTLKNYYKEVQSQGHDGIILPDHPDGIEYVVFNDFAFEIISSEIILD